MKIQHLILEAFTKKNSLHNLTRFYGGRFELEILEIFTAFLLKTITILTRIFLQYCSVLSLKRKKNSQKRCESPRQ